MNKPTIAVLPKLESLAGPASFYARFTATVRKRGYAVHNDPIASGVDAILVIAGTKHILELVKAKRRGIRIVQRLDNINWQHRHMNTGAYHYLRSEVGNLMMQTIRKRLADRIVYQSEFAKQWWSDVYQSTGKPTSVVFNGVDLDEYSPEGPEMPPSDHIRIQVIEGRMAGGQEKGLENAIRMTQLVQNRVDQKVELCVIGKVPSKIKAYWEANAGIWINFVGQIPRSEVPSRDRSAHVLFSADLNGACPNVVVESLACGLPVVSFDTGALPELVEDEGGLVVPYGTNVWKLEMPVYEPLAEAAVEVINNNKKYREAARRRAERLFNIESVVDRYLEALFSEEPL
jgi:glycosyltransferase involved in cell wall biosynthesis